VIIFAPELRARYGRWVTKRSLLWTLFALGVVALAVWVGCMFAPLSALRLVTLALLMIEAAVLVAVMYYMKKLKVQVSGRGSCTLMQMKLDKVDDNLFP
jgi:uncharacterized membrane protein